MWPWTSLSALLPHWRVFATALAAAALVWRGWHAHAVVTEAGHAEQLREQIDARKVAEDFALEVSLEAEEEQARLEQENLEVARRTAHEAAKPDYRARLHDAGRVLLNAACCSGAGAGEPDAAVPATDAPR